jgi:hypothetical protein
VPYSIDSEQTRKILPVHLIIRRLEKYFRHAFAASDQKALRKQGGNNSIYMNAGRVEELNAVVLRITKQQGEFSAAEY